MRESIIKAKFGGYYKADSTTYKLGIDIHFTEHFAERFKNLTVLETCTGGGFTTISLARKAKHIYSVEINKSRMDDAIYNVKLAGVNNKITFFNMDVLSGDLIQKLPEIDAAFLDPDWADTEEGYIYSFVNSKTKPPSNVLLEYVFGITPNIALIQPPYIDNKEFRQLPDHECERLYINNNHELYCLYFGLLVNKIGDNEFRI